MNEALAVIVFFLFFIIFPSYSIVITKKILNLKKKSDNILNEDISNKNLIIKLETENNKLVDKINYLKTENNELENEKKQLEDNFNYLHENNKNYASKYKLLNQELTNLKYNYENSQNENDIRFKDQNYLKTENNNLKSHLKIVLNNFDNEINNSINKDIIIKNLTDKIKTFEDQNISSSNNKFDFEIDLNNLNIEKEQLIKKIKTLNELEIFLLNEVKKLNETKDNLEKNINNKLNTNNILSDKDLRELEYKKREVDFNIKELERTYTSKKKIYDELVKELNKVENANNLIEFGFYKPFFNFNTSEEYKEKIINVKEEQKYMINQETACTCSTTWLVGNSHKKGEQMTKKYIKLMLRAFNGECDSVMLKIRWDNIMSMQERIKNSFKAINKLGESHYTYLSDEYLKLKLDELNLSFEYEEKKYKEKEEQKRIQEQIREEEKAQKEIKEVIQKAESEESKYKKELEKLQKEMEEEKLKIEKANTQKLDQLDKHIQLLEKRIIESNQNKQRAISRAELTKSGYVYIISNKGSFGENIYKVGMTRRLDPMERIRELSSASVPFSFDVHAFIYSDNAPELERLLHTSLEDKRVNLVNERKEFFKLQFEDLETIIKNKNLDINLIKDVESKEYNETLSMILKNESKLIDFSDYSKNSFPDSITSVN